MYKLKYGVFIMSVCFASMANADDPLPPLKHFTKEVTIDNTMADSVVSSKWHDSLADSNITHERLQAVKKSMTDAANGVNSLAQDVTENRSQINKNASDIRNNANAIDSLKNTKASVTLVNDTLGAAKGAAITARDEAEAAKGSAARAENALKETATKVDDYKLQVDTYEKNVAAVEETANAAKTESALAIKTADEAMARVEGAVKESKAYTDAKFKEFDNKIENVKKFAAAGSAAAMAAAQIPQVSQGSAFSLGVGMGNYAGQSALSLGISARLGDYTITKVAVTSDSMNNTGASMGIAVEW